MAFFLSERFGLVDQPSASLVSGNPLFDWEVEKIINDASFGTEAIEVFYGEYTNGQTVPLPISPIDRYPFSRSECFYLAEHRLTYSATNNRPSAAGQILQTYAGVDPSTGQVASSVAYYVQGGGQTNTNDGLVGVFTFAIRGWGDPAFKLATQPSFTDIPNSSFALDQPLTQTLLRQLNDNARRAPVSTEIFFNAAVPIQSITRFNGIVSCVTASAHGLAVGRKVLVQIFGGDPTFGGLFTVATAVDLNHLTWAQPGPDSLVAAPPTGRITIYQYQNGDTVPLPTSSVDGYAYSRAECVYLPVLTSSANPTTGITSGAGRQRFRSRSVNASTGLISTQVNYWDGKTETVTQDGALNVLVVATRTQPVLGAVASPLVQIDESKLFLGNQVDESVMQNLNTLAKGANLVPEIFTATYTNGQTVALPVSSRDGYAYSRSELSYIWGMIDTAGGTALGGILQTIANVDQATGLVSTEVDFVTDPGNFSSTSFGDVFVITFARRNIQTLVQKLLPGSPTYTPSIPVGAAQFANSNFQYAAGTGIGLNFTINTNGTGYTVGDILTVTEAGASGGSLKVTSTGGGGAVSGAVPQTHGTGYTAATNLATTGGTGSGFTINLTGPSFWIDWFWDGTNGSSPVVIYFMDGSTLTVSGNLPDLADHGANATAYYYPYWDQSLGLIVIPHFSGYIRSPLGAQAQSQQGRISLSMGGMAGVSVAAGGGTGGGGGGGSSGGTGACPRGSERLYVYRHQSPSLLTGQDAPIGSVEPGDYFAGPGGRLQLITRVERFANAQWFRTRFSNGRTVDVSRTHLWETAEGELCRAAEALGQQLPSRDGRPITITAIEPIQESDEAIAIWCVPDHRFAIDDVLMHNLQKM